MLAWEGQEKDRKEKGLTTEKSTVQMTDFGLTQLSSRDSHYSGWMGLSSGEISSH